MDVVRSKLWAFDPGVTTGVSWWDLSTGEFWADELQETDLYELVDQSCCDSATSAQIEKFTITTQTIKKGREMDPIYIIGYLRYKSWVCGFPVGWSKPADVMRSFPDASLKQAGMFTKGKGHANDSARHLAWALVKSGVRPAKEFLI